MSNLQHRQSKIQEKRKNTPWREFIQQLVSRYPLMLYKHDSIISRYPDTVRKPNLCKVIDFIDRDNVTQVSPNHNNNFFESLTHIFRTTKLPYRSYFGNCENADFAEYVENSRNCYLSFVVCNGSENVVYSVSIFGASKNIFDSVFVTNLSENIYGSFAIENSMNVFYSKHITSSAHIYFSSNLIGCQNCVFCDNLQNQSYCINNKKLSPAEYQKEKKRIMSDPSLFQSYKDQVNTQGGIYASTSSSGSGLFECNDVHQSFGVSKVSHGHNNIFVAGITGATYIYDVIDAGYDMHHSYGLVLGGLHSKHYYCCSCAESSNNIYYSIQMESCSFCLGCIGLKNKSYCIFNKQYTKEERYQKVDEIFGQMERDGTLGEFFPASMNPFYFNDTAAYLIDPSFTKEEVTAAGYLRRDEPIKVDIPEGMEVVLSSELSNYEGLDSEGNRTINADILKCVIQDESGNYYRIIPMEYKFLVKHGLPLPRKHWLERMKENFKVVMVKSIRS